MKNKPGKLWEATRKLHHACEEHPVGAAMASGKPNMEWYADWLYVLLTLHSVVDEIVPDEAKRVSRILDDIQKCGVRCKVNITAHKYAQSLKTQNQLEGAAYVLTGAHLMGGEIMKRRLVGYPVEHLQWDDRRESLEYLKSLRNREELANSAKDCFAALLFSMEEIFSGEKMGNVEKSG